MNRLKTNICLFVSLGLFSLTVVSFVLLVSSTSSALTISGSSPVIASATAAVNVSEACTFEGYLNSPHTATLNPGTSKANIGSTTFTTICNDTNGYSIYAVGYTGETVGSTVLAANINGVANSTYDIATGTATSGGTSNWAMMLAPVSGNNPTITNSFNAYHSVPTTYTQVATYGSATTSGGTGSQVTATYQVFATSAQPAGLYAGKVKYIMVHPANETPPVEVACANNKICYNANTNIKEGTMGQQDGNANAEVTLLASNFSKSGYGFAGWNTKPDYSGDFYGPNETITVPSTASSGGTPLYAVWVKSSGNLQGWSGCSSLTKVDEATDILSQSIRALTDQRDGQTYAVAKLADGKCWMIENLRLEADDSSDSTLAQGFGGVFTGLADAESANFSNSTTANSLYSTTNITGSNQGYRFPRYNNINTSTRASSPTSGSDVNIYSYGNYYTWAAAMANTENLTSYSASEAANTSLCPTGWQLPYGRSTGNGSTAGGFSNLDIALGGTGANQSSTAGTTQSQAWRSYPNNFLYSGYVNSSSVVSTRGSYGYYWPSTASGVGSAYYLNFSSTYVGPGTGDNIKYVGRTIRCVAL